MHEQTRALIDQMALEDGPAAARLDRWASQHLPVDAPEDAPLIAAIVHVRAIAAADGSREARETADALTRFGQWGGNARMALWCQSASVEAALVSGASLDAILADAAADPLQAAVPVDLPDFAWTPAAPEIEREAWWRAVAALEAALDHGDLVPGSLHWRQQRHELVERVLNEVVTVRTEEALHTDETLREVIERGRRAAWAEAVVTPRQRAAAAEVLAATASGPSAPPSTCPDAAASVAPLRALLDLLDGGVALSMDGSVPRGVARAVVEAAGWRARGRGRRRAARTAVDAALGLLLHAGLVGVSAGATTGGTDEAPRLATTELGRALLEEPWALWRLVTGGGLRPEASWALGLETALLLLAEQPRWQTAALAAVLADELRGRLDAAGRHAVDWPAAAADVLGDLRAHGRALGFLDEEEDTVTVTSGGAATVLALLDGRARGPRRRADAAAHLLRR